MKKGSDFKNSLNDLMAALKPIQRKLIKKYGQVQFNTWQRERRDRDASKDFNITI